ncbi:MAG: hypothetical protein LM550_13960 [Candidatus Contendobacter sp.]|nr:type II secretion system F family protein [Gammaproteobacteria bacterium]MCC8994758.1 hypothetical protein [Candidatus Contendobacter sp.]
MNPALSAHTRSRLFAQLATLERAGIPPAQAFTLIGDDLPLKERRSLTQTAAALARGMSIAEAGENHGVWLPWETRTIRGSGWAAGKPVRQPERPLRPSLGVIEPNAVPTKSFPC